jgi:pSer/pThr/pTyr-binding forkhead associated (FHA) protein
MPEPLLTVLKFSLLALLYLFFLRVLRAVWAELGAGPGGTTAGGRAAARGAGRSGPVGHLKVVEPPEGRGRTFALTSDEITIGRAPGCHVALTDDGYVSQLHARVFARDGRFFVEDLGSTNGTYLNRKKVTGPVALRRGDRLQVGRTVLEVQR